MINSLMRTVVVRHQMTTIEETREKKEYEKIKHARKGLG